MLEKEEMDAQPTGPARDQEEWVHPNQRKSKRWMHSQPTRPTVRQTKCIQTHEKLEKRCTEKTASIRSAPKMAEKKIMLNID